MASVVEEPQEEAIEPAYLMGHRLTDKEWFVTNNTVRWCKPDHRLTEDNY